MVVFVGSLLVLSVLTAALILWSDPNAVLDDVNLISRLVGTVALTAAAITPLALQQAWGAGDPSRRPAPRPWWATAAAVGIVAVAAVAYPASVVAGGAPRFPGRRDCGEVKSGSPIVVFGRASTYEQAIPIRDRVVRRGFDASVARDGCGDVGVFAADVASLAAAQMIARRARASGVAATVERGSGP
jgi:hypothetical protein